MTAIFSFSIALKVCSASTIFFVWQVPLLIITCPGHFIALKALVFIVELGCVVQQGEKEKARFCTSIKLNKQQDSYLNNYIVFCQIWLSQFVPHTHWSYTHTYYWFSTVTLVTLFQHLHLVQSPTNLCLLCKNIQQAVQMTTTFCLTPLISISGPSLFDAIPIPEGRISCIHLTFHTVPQLSNAPWDRMCDPHSSFFIYQKSTLMPLII